MANYKVGDLEVAINGVSKDAVSSLDEVIKQLDTLQGKLGIVGKGFSGAFKNINSGAIRTVVQDFGDIQRASENATESQREWNGEIKSGQADAQQYSTALVAVSEAQENVESSFRRLTALLNATTYNRLSSDVSNLATQWKNLYTTMQMSNVADESTGGQFSPEAQNRLTRLTQEYLNKKRAIDETNEAFKRMAMTEQELALYDYQQENASRKQRITYLNLMLTTKQAGEKTAEYKRELRELTKEQQKADKVAGVLHKGSFGKLITRISRIALYRTIRRGLQIITQAFKSSIQEFAMVDNNINDMMTKLTSSTKVISMSFGTILLPLLQAITPAVQSLSVGFANMANTINASMAKMNNLATYTKINVKALQDYREQLNKTSGALFDFDKFRALSGSNKSPFLEEAAVADLNKEVGASVGLWTVVYDILHNIGNILKNVILIAGQILQAISPWVLTFTSALDFVLRIASGLISVLEKTGLISPIIGGILGYLTLMGTTKFITWLKSGSLVQWIKNATTSTAGFGKTLLTTLSSTKALAIGIGALVGSIAYFVQNFDEMGATAKWLVPLIAAVTATVIGLTTALVAFYNAHLGIGAAIKAGLTAAAISGAVALAIGTSVAKATPKYAMGASDIDGGSLFIAGEAGKTEMVYTGDNGKTNVANVQQMYQAEYMAVLQALKDYGAARGEMPQLQPVNDNGIYQAAERGAKKHGKKFANY